MGFSVLWSMRALFGALLCVGSYLYLSARIESELHISADAEFVILHKYPALKTHKAFAVGAVGNWGYGSDWRSPENAAINALARCENRRLSKSEIKRLRGKNCVLFDVDGKRTGLASPIGIPFGTVAEGEDLPWRLGKEWRASTPGTRGTMLFLHGCYGLDNSEISGGWQLAWVNYYRAIGFRVIAPDSFADTRDATGCGELNERTINRQTRIMKLRIAQTLRTIAGIRQKYPAEPLYIHGHSEGGWVAQALNEKVDGIIATASTCGFGSSRTYLPAKDVPLLVIAGTEDDSVYKGRNAANAFGEDCKAVAGTARISWVSVAGRGQAVALWWPEVRGAVSNFLKTPAVTIGRPRNDGIAYPKLSASAIRKYNRKRETPWANRAIAASRKGNWAVSVGESQLDAEETALFGCDARAGADAYLDSTQQHSCVLVDVNGQ